MGLLLSPFAVGPVRPNQLHRQRTAVCECYNNCINRAVEIIIIIIIIVFSYFI